jgi:hypothetical protein
MMGSKDKVLDTESLKEKYVTGITWFGRGKLDLPRESRNLFLNWTPPGDVNLRIIPAGDVMEAIEEATGVLVSKTIDIRFDVVLSGEDFEFFIRMIHDLRGLKVSKQVWTLNSLNTNLTGKYSTAAPLYRLVIEDNIEETTCRIIEGRWRPIFDNVEQLAGWVI